MTAPNGPADIPVEHRRQVILDAIAVEKADRFRAEVFAAGRPEGSDVADTATAQLDAIDGRLGVLQQMLAELPAEEPKSVERDDALDQAVSDAMVATEPTAAGLPVDPTP